MIFLSEYFSQVIDMCGDIVVCVDWPWHRMRASTSWHQAKWRNHLLLWRRLLWWWKLTVRMFDMWKVSLL